MRQAYQWACEAAETLDDRPAFASSLRQWGRGCIEQGDYAEAEEHLSRSLQLWQELDDQAGEASTQYYLGRVAVERADYDKAQQLLTESQRIRQQLGDMAGVAETLYQQVYVQYEYENFEKAKSIAQQALDIQQTFGDKLGCIRTMGKLADIVINQDDYERGEQFCQQALALCEEIQEQGELAVILYIWSKALWRRGDLSSARDYAERSLTLFTRMGDRKSQAWAFRRLSLIDVDLKNYDLALEESTHSLNLHRELENPWNMIFVLLDLGDVHQALDQSDQAYEMWAEALSLAEKLQKHPLTETLRERLDTQA
jgi:tetratricopeptide (TPR) repeat protein